MTSRDQLPRRTVPTGDRQRRTPPAGIPKSRRPGGRLRVMFFVEALTIVTSAGALLRGTRHAVVLFVALSVFAVGRAAWSKWPARSSILVWVAIVVLIISLPKSGPTHAGTHSKLISHHHRTGMTVGPSTILATGARAVSVSDAGVTVVTSEGAMLDNPAIADDTHALGIPSSVYDLASDGPRFVAVEGGKAQVYGGSPVKPLGMALGFNEADGHVTVSGTQAWLCSTFHSKIDWLDLQTGEAGEVAVAAAPVAITSSGGFVWASIANGYIARIEASTHSVEQFPTESDPQALTVAFSSVWVYHGLGQDISELAVTTGAEVARPIPGIAPGVVALAGYHGSIFAISTDADLLEQINTATRRVVGMLHINDPSGLVVFAGQLWVVSEDGWIAPVLPKPYRPAGRQRRRS